MRTREAARGAVVAAALATLAAAWLVTRPWLDLPYLDGGGPGEWIVHPLVPSATLRPAAPLEATFRREVELAESPRSAGIQVRAFRHFVVSVNGRRVGESDPTRGWRRVAVLDVTGQLSAGRNRIEVVVRNDKGPPGLDLRLNADGERVVSDPTWEVSLAGGPWQPARLATERMRFDPGVARPEHASVPAALRARWPHLAAIAAAAALTLGLVAWLGGLVSSARVREFGPLVVVLGLWVVLLGHNAPLLPVGAGFDGGPHLQYVRYVQEQRALPLGNEGWQMYQPPLFYALCAGALGLLGLGVADPGAALVLRALTGLAGLAQISLLYAGVRLALPGDRSAALAGLALAGFLPAHLTLFHFATNEALAMPLAAGASALCVRVLRDGSAPARRLAGLGLVLGAAVLAKFSAVLLVPAVLGALAVRGFRTRELGLVAAVFVAATAWHFGRVWAAFGNPFIGNWDPALGFSWWQDPGYRTLSDYVRFGRSLVVPWFAGFSSVPDGLFSTFWGDGLAGGEPRVELGPPWDRGLVAAGYALACLPAALLALGAARALARFWRGPDAVTGYLLGLAWIVGMALLYTTILVPSYAQAKAFYAQVAMLPVVVFFALGVRWAEEGGRGVRALVVWGLATWAAVAYASHWIDADAPGTLAVQGLARLDAGDTAGAEPLLLRALDSDPGCGAAQWGLMRLGLELESRGDLGGAIAALRRLGGARPEPATRIRVGALLARSGDVEASVRELEGVVRDHPDDAQARITLGSVLQSAGRSGDATDSFARALALAPDHPEALRRLAWIRVLDPDPALRDPEEALALAKRLCAGRTCPAADLDLLAAAHAEAGRFDDALRTARRALERAQHDGDAELARSIATRLDLYRAGRPLSAAVDESSERP